MAKIRKWKIRKISFYLLGLFTLGLLLFNHFAPRLIIQTNSGIITWLRPLDKSNIEDINDFELQYYPFQVTTQDDFNLECNLIYTQRTKQKGTIILVHGIRAYKEHFLLLASFLAKQGYNSVLIDLRAHGKSDGKYCTFGYYEKNDLKILVDSVFSFKNVSRRIGIWGQSLGGAIAIQALENDKRLQFGIIESTFSEFKTTVKDYFNYHVEINISFLVNYLISRAEFIGDFDVDKIKPSGSVKNISQPVLMVHGKMDKRINISYARENYKNLKSSNKKFIEYPNANHLNVWKQEGDLYFKKVLRFIESLNAK